MTRPTPETVRAFWDPQGAARDAEIDRLRARLALAEGLAEACRDICDLGTPGATSCEYEGAELAAEMAATARAALTAWESAR